MNGVELAQGFLKFLEELDENKNFGDWQFIGRTDIAYPTPIGAWTETGYLFKKYDSSFSFVLRSIVREEKKEYKIVIESVNLQGQLYNIDLNKTKTHKPGNRSSTLFESFTMTIGHGRRKSADVQRAFQDLGVNSNVVSELNDDSPDWEKFTKDILNWGALRERVKINLKDNLENPNAPEKTHIEMNHTVKISDFPLNQILYGSPGTGKTYTTIAKAVGIIDGLSDDNLESKSREELKNRFEQLKNDGQIVFCTFHQSMSYEDFIEGIKPGLNQNQQVIYDLQAGVFKSIAILANDNRLYAKTEAKESLTFDEAFESLKEEWEENQNMKFPLKREGKEFKIIGFSNTSISFEKASGGIDHSFSISTLKEFFYGTREMLVGGLGNYYPALLSKLKSYRVAADDVVEKKEKNFVLIIDEINRGNVSQIFGELISLIEEDKRLGASEALEATLPYSKEKFGVPQNLHIIGTMNTADRSVEALDTALRRRFSFEEITPKPNLLEAVVEGLSLRLILETINKRIEKLLDRDHQIGHSYFLSVKSLDDLRTVFRNKINPLLQEYFFGDYGKIGLILGRGFVSLDEQQTGSLFADFAYDDAYSFLEKPVYKLKDISKMDDTAFKDAVSTLLNSAVG